MGIRVTECTIRIVVVLGFNDMSTLVGHFVSSPRESEKIDGRDSRGDEREGQGRKRNRTEMEKIQKKLEMCQYDTDAPAQGHPHPHTGILQKMNLKKGP